VAARNFEDSAGTRWEVFEVRRTSHKAEAVSPGLEGGWLAFASGSRKRRLAPYPAEWQTVDDAELERLCRLARGAGERPLAEARSRATEPRDATARIRVPRLRPLRADRSVAPVDRSDAPADRSDAPAGQLHIEATAVGGDAVEATVRAFAHEARARRVPAVEAMVRLKVLLSRVFTDPTSPARNVRAVRRWFVDAYYFERDATPTNTLDQSR
jgi:hypothetical protein